MSRHRRSGFEWCRPVAAEVSVEVELEDLARQYKVAIEVTAATNAILREIDSDPELIRSRDVQVINLQGMLNVLRGFDALKMGC